MKSGDERMNDSDRELFLVGVRVEMARRGGMNYKELSEITDISRPTITRFFKRKPVGETARQRKKRLPGDDSIEKICAGLKKSTEYFIMAGKTPTDESGDAFLSKDFLPQSQFSKMLSAMEDSYVKINERMHMWKNAFDNLPLPSLIIKDGVVFVQNKKSVLLGETAGLPLCEQCINKTCGGGREGCAVQTAIKLGIESSEEVEINGERIIVCANPWGSQEHNYVVVTATMLHG